MSGPTGLVGGPNPQAGGPLRLPAVAGRDTSSTTTSTPAKAQEPGKVTSRYLTGNDTSWLVGVPEFWAHCQGSGWELAAWAIVRRMPRKPNWWHQLQAGKQEALLAVDLYNRPGEDRRLEAFVVHMQIAWLYLAQARFGRDGVDYWYRNASGRRIRGSDGEFRTWDLARCLKEVFPALNDPVRRNVEFFVSLRNRIEHRYERLLDPVVAGKCQSLIMNYETALTGWFGVDEGLASRLRFPVFLSTLAGDAVEALKQTYKRLPKRITNYLEGYDASDLDPVCVVGLGCSGV